MSKQLGDDDAINAFGSSSYLDARYDLQKSRIDFKNSMKALDAVAIAYVFSKP